jgi:hypothetical protein
MTRVWLYLALMTACGNGHVDKPSNASRAGDSMTKPSGSGGSKATFVRGVATSPKDDLHKWLETQKLDGKPRLLRVPIILAKGATGYDISKARIGSGGDALEVYANDSSLGVGLADRASQICKNDEPTCGFWVEGYWSNEAGPEIGVRKAEPIPVDQLKAAMFVEVEGEGGN